MDEINECITKLIEFVKSNPTTARDELIKAFLQQGYSQSQSELATDRLIALSKKDTESGTATIAPNH